MSGLKSLCLFLGSASLLLGATLAASIPADSAAKKLQVYFVDVEGGQSTLFVTPEGKSLLIDTGWNGNDSRDADRIAAAAKRAGISKIDYVLITHYHDDHVGGVPQLVQKIPVGAFIDHGENREAIAAANYTAYQKVLASGSYKRIVATPGVVLPIAGMRVQVISGDGQLTATPLPGGGEQNSFCASSETRPADQTENARSLGVLITFGKLKILDLGDLTWDKEMQLMCPVNKLGKVDVLIVSHHGWDQSSSPALVDAVHAKVAIMDNGGHKGGSAPTVDTIRKAPGLEDLWQLHQAEDAAVHNAPEEFLANLPGPDQGNYLELTASPNGSFTVLNSRTEKSKSY